MQTVMWMKSHARNEEKIIIRFPKYIIKEKWSGNNDMIKLVQTVYKNLQIKRSAWSHGAMTEQFIAKVTA